MTPQTATLDTLCVNSLRGLAIDAVQKANSGHPGLPMGAAAMAYAIWTRHLRHNPKNPGWFNRDRFILSAGHGSALLYSLLYLTGYEVSLDDLKQFRQWGSITPGHPEVGLTPGVEMSTGPLGQGISTSVGFAIAESYLAARYNKPGHEVVDHFTYVLASDGDLMEGVTQEAASLAGHLQLGKLIVLYDDNHITIDGTTEQSFTEDTAAKYAAYGWQVLRADGLDFQAVSEQIEAAKAETGKPSLIICRTTIGFGSPNRANTSKVHGSPLGAEEMKLTKENLGLPQEPFTVCDQTLAVYRKALEDGPQQEHAWLVSMTAYAKAYPAEVKELLRLIGGELGDEWLQALPTFADSEATRVIGFKALNAVAGSLPGLIGGSADLAESVKAAITGHGTYTPETRDGRNIMFGIREHAMAAIVNGITLHGGTRGFGGTFHVFCDYCRPSLRLAALMHCPSIFVFSHDSIGVGEDGPTHQPIEQTMALRLIPNFNVMRPADPNETVACYKIALELKDTPSAILLTRQKVPATTPSDVRNHPAEKGGYVLQEAEGGAPQLVLVATGSEVGLAVSAKTELEKQGIATRVVNMPSWLLYERQDRAYRAGVLPKGVPTVSIEAGTTIGWGQYAQAHVGIDHFGASAPGGTVMKEFGFTVENVVATAKSLLG